MDFETIDWEQESQRVARAFGIEEQCHFVMENDLVTRKLYVGEEPYIFVSRTKLIGVDYFELGHTFQAVNPRRTKAEAFVSLDWGVSILMSQPEAELSPLLAKPLFHLGLLTPEVEAALKVTITAHQKLEWALEYERRYGF